MGQEEKKKLYYACKDYGLDVKWNMSEAALKEIHDAYISDMKAEEAKAKKEIENKAKEAEKAEKAKAKKEADAKKKAEKAKAKAKAEKEINELERDAGPDIIVTFIDDDDEDDYIPVIDDHVVSISKPKKVAKAKRREQVLKSRYFPAKNPKKKSVSESPLEIYNKQMTQAGKRSRANRRKYRKQSIN